MTDPMKESSETTAADRFESAHRSPPLASEGMLAALRPAPVSDALMARLVAARPVQAPPTARLAAGDTGSRTIPWRRVLWVGGIGAAAAWVAAARLDTPPKATTAVDPPPVTAAPAASAPSTVFLPVESNRTLVLLEPTRVIQEPDEPPRRFARAVWIDDITAVGAEDDAALHLRRTREAIVPVSSPVY
jgi:hypothetical protein